MRTDRSKLRNMVDGSDSFIGGFQIGGLRKHKRKPQPWVNNQKEVQKMLLTAFPKLATNERQRKRAARWVRVLYLYYNLQYTRTQVAADLSITPKAVEMIIERISCAHKGLGSRLRGTQRSLNRGRPKKLARVIGGPIDVVSKGLKSNEESENSYLYQTGESGLRADGA